MRGALITTIPVQQYIKDSTNRTFRIRYYSPDKIYRKTVIAIKGFGRKGRETAVSYLAWLPEGVHFFARCSALVLSMDL